MVSCHSLHEHLEVDQEFVVGVLAEGLLIQLHERGDKRLVFRALLDTLQNFKQFSSVLLLIGIIKVCRAESLIGKRLVRRVPNHLHDRIDVLVGEWQWAYNFIQNFDQVLLCDDFLHFLVLIAEEQLDRLLGHGVPLFDSIEDLSDQALCLISGQFHGVFNVLLELLDVDPLAVAAFVQFLLSTFFLFFRCFCFVISCRSLRFWLSSLSTFTIFFVSWNSRWFSRCRTCSILCFVRSRCRILCGSSSKSVLLF